MATARMCNSTAMAVTDRNVDGFTLTSNTIHDNNNIGIGMTGGWGRLLLGRSGRPGLPGLHQLLASRRPLRPALPLARPPLRQHVDTQPQPGRKLAGPQHRQHDRRQHPVRPNLGQHQHPAHRTGHRHAGQRWQRPHTQQHRRHWGLRELAPISARRGLRPSRRPLFCLAHSHATATPTVGATWKAQSKRHRHRPRPRRAWNVARSCATAIEGNLDLPVRPWATWRAPARRPSTPAA